MKKILLLLSTIFLLNGCAESLALLGPGASNGRFVQSSLNSAISYGVKKQTGKTDDPVRLYLRDMGSVELLSREGEIAIAKRIESGRELMIGAICESPMTIRSIINWKDSIKEGTMLLRDIVDLEQTYDMSDVGDTKAEDTIKIIEGDSQKKENIKKK